MHFALSSGEHSASRRTMQAAHNRAMSSERPSRTIRRANLQAILQEFGGPKELMRLSGVTDTHLTACAKGRRDIGDAMADSIERGVGLPHGWMDTRQYPPSDGPIQPLVAREMSERMIRVAPTLITLEQLVAGTDLDDELYIMAAPDDALSPDYPAGISLQWSPTKAPRPGSIVAVKDSTGQVFVRQFRPGKTTGHWTAAAINPVYFSLDSTADSLTILLVAAYQPMP